MIKIKVKSVRESKSLKEWFSEKDFKAMDPSEQEQYLNEHPNSKFGTSVANSGNTPDSIKQDMENWKKNKVKQLNKQDKVFSESDSIKASKSANKKAKEIAANDPEFAKSYKNALNDYKWERDRAQRHGWGEEDRKNVLNAGKVIAELFKSKKIEVPEKFYPLGK